MLQKTSRSNSESFTELTMKGESVLGYCQVTVFTSTYNRRYTLERLYESLRGQTVKPMEWIIVDDGSSDDTYQLIFPWIETEIDFEIIYLRVKNGGKHRAINKACDLARGDLFCIVDSDDYLTNDAIEKIITWEQSIQGKPGYAGVAGNKGFSDHQLIGRTFESEYVDATSLEREKYQIEGDKAEVFYTSVLKKYKFPEIQGENFITESVVWFHIASDGLKIRWFNDIIYIANYLEDGLTKNGDQLIQKNPKGTLLTQYLQASYYQQFILKEKEEVRHYIHEVLVSGDLEAGITYLNGLIPRVKNNIDIQLMLAQLYLYLGKISVAKNILNDMTMVYSKDARPYLKLGKIEERQQQLSLAVSHYQKALLYLDESANQSLIEKLKKTYHFTSNQIDRVLLIRVKEHYKKGELEEAKQLIIKNPAIDESYRLELGFYFNNERFVYYIIGLILGVDDISSSPEDLDYVKAHQLFDQCQYDQSLVYLFKVLSKQLTPLSLYRLSYILKQKGQLGLATKYENLYRLVSNQIKSSGRIYFIEESTTPLHKFRTDINTIFHQMGFHSLNRELELGNFNFSIFDTVLFQYPFSSNVEKIFNSCCTLNLKTILVVHQVEDLNEMIQLNQASRLIVMSHDLKTKLIEQGCYCQLLVREHLDYLINQELVVPTFSKNVILVEDDEILDDWNDNHSFTLNVYGKKTVQERTHLIYKGEFDLEQTPLKLEGSFGLVSPHTTIDSWQVSLYLLTKRPLICFEGTELATFVLEHELGFVISTLDEIEAKLNEISNEDYAYMVDHMTPYSINIASGVYFKQALATALK